MEKVNLDIFTSKNNLRVLITTGIILSFTVFYLIKSDASPFLSGLFPKVSLIILMVIFLLEFKNALNKEKELSETDYLTGVKNRRGFFKRAELELIRAKKKNQPVSLIYMDIDNFKVVNDKLGHLSGDTLLTLFSANLSGIIRQKDVVARLGGDEFVILLPETSPESAESVVNRIQEIILNKSMFRDLTITCSIGVVTFVHQSVTINQMITVADSLMYRVKKSGKNGFQKEVFGMVPA
jgi:diguanylate cyclase (GGDEF)-like protein